MPRRRARFEPLIVRSVINNVVTSNESARVLVTDILSKEAQSAGKVEATQPAVNGHGGGKALPPESTSPIHTKHEARTPEPLQEVKRAAVQIEQYVQSVQRDLRFYVDEESGRSIVRVVDRTTQKTIRQIPSEEVVQMARNLGTYRAQEQLDALQRSASRKHDPGLHLLDTRI